MNTTIKTSATPETKTCTECHIEKPLSEYHRREGDRRHNICKACLREKANLRAAGKLPHTKRSAQKDNSANFDIIEQRIRKLSNRLYLIARSYARDGYQADDIYQHICEKLLVKCDPSATDAWITNFAKLRAGEFVNAERVYTWHVGAENDLIPTGSVEDEETFEVYVGDTRSAEDMVIEQEQAKALHKILAGLDDRNSQIVALIEDGLTITEISLELGISRQTVYNSLEKISVSVKLTL